MKKTLISMLLTMIFILSMSVSVFAGDYIDPSIIARVGMEQSISE